MAGRTRIISGVLVFVGGALASGLNMFLVWLGVWLVFERADSRATGEGPESPLLGCAVGAPVAILLAIASMLFGLRASPIVIGQFVGALFGQLVSLPIGDLTIVVLSPLGQIIGGAIAIPFSRQRVLSGHCRKCDYDLTGNTSDVCPECGTAIKPPS